MTISSARRAKVLPGSKSLCVPLPGTEKDDLLTQNHSNAWPSNPRREERQA